MQGAGGAWLRKPRGLVQTPDGGGSCALWSHPGHSLLHGKSFGKKTLKPIVMLTLLLLAEFSDYKTKFLLVYLF